MKSAILEKGEHGFTMLGPTFQAIKQCQKQFNWLITDCECYPPTKELEALFSKKWLWISGHELTTIIEKTDFQFIWGVFSGFTKDVAIEDILKSELPFADGYKGFWTDNVSIQHPLAEIEIVAWDSSLTILMSNIDKIVDDFKSAYPLAEDLKVKNIRQNAEIKHIESLLINELFKNNLEVNEERINMKYAIWRKLYCDKVGKIEDKDILNCIQDTLV